jgi:hypothetical protein
MYWLPHFLSKAYERRRPHLVLITSSPQKRQGTPGVDQMVGAALFDEYVVRGLRTRTFSTDDQFGFRTIFAQPQDRARVTTLACEALLNRSAHVVLAVYEDIAGEAPEMYLQPRSDRIWTSSKRVAGKYLELQDTYEKTLRQLGKATRFNLGYYRRRLEKLMQCEFVSDAIPHLTLEALQEINAGSRDPVTRRMCTQRWETVTTLPGSFLVGLRTKDGKWLGVIGGWRHEDTTVLQWQMNRGGMDELSVGTVVRSYYIENEVNRKTRRLVFHNGTPHTIQNSFAPMRLCEFVLRRRSLLSSIIIRASRLFSEKGTLGLHTTHITDVLSDATVIWRSAAEVSSIRVVPDKSSSDQLSPLLHPLSESNSREDGV